MRLSFKMIVTMMALLALAAGMVELLNYHKYKTLFESLVKSRVDVVMSTLQSSVQEPLQIGLSLEDTRTIGDLIQQTKSQDPLIVAISVYSMDSDGTGRVLYSTQDEAVGTPVPAAWAEAMTAGGSQTLRWSSQTDNQHIIGGGLVDRLDRVVGGVALSYSKDYELQNLASIREELFETSFMVVDVAILLSALLVFVIFRPISRLFVGLGATLDGKGSQTVPASALADGDSEGLTQALTTFKARSTEAAASLDALETALNEAEAAAPGAAAGTPGADAPAQESAR